MNQKVFPIKTATACQLKWSHSTVFLTRLSTSSCHRVEHNKFDLDNFNFHNTPEKIRDRKLMLQGQWPGHGCQHCKNIEDAGGTSDRMVHLDFPGITAPPELESDLTAVEVTPRILEIYFSNVCNLKCTYCFPFFSSQINQEYKKFGEFQKNGLRIPSAINLPTEYPEATNKMFEWLDKNITSLNKLLILGGEPFIQKETQRLLEFLPNKKLNNLDLVIFSNLTINPIDFQKQIEKLKQIQQNVNHINIVASIDCWGRPAEYVRNGLNLNWFQTNFEYLLNHTNFVLNINSAIGPLTIPTMPDLIKKINYWSSIRTVYWSFMKIAGHDYLHPAIFGKEILNKGFTQSIELFDPMGDPEKIKYKDYLNGIALEIKQTQPNKNLQKQLKTYLIELDRRRNTDYKIVFPEIANLLEYIEV